MAGMRSDQSKLAGGQVLAGNYRHEDATQADGQGEMEGGPLAQAAVDSQFAAMRPHQLAGDTQSEAQPPRVGIGAIGNPVKALEDALHVRPGDARFVILHGHPQEVGFVVAIVRGHLHRASVSAVLDGVIDEIGQHQAMRAGL